MNQEDAHRALGYIYSPNFRYLQLMESKWLAEQAQRLLFHVTERGSVASFFSDVEKSVPKQENKEK